jgi:hypothetical protein
MLSVRGQGRCVRESTVKVCGFPRASKTEGGGGGAPVQKTQANADHR